MEDIECPRCHSKKIKTLRHLYLCKVCNHTWDQKEYRRIVSKGLTFH